MLKGRVDVEDLKSNQEQLEEIIIFDFVDDMTDFFILKKMRKEKISKQK